MNMQRRATSKLILLQFYFTEKKLLMASELKSVAMKDNVSSTVEIQLRNIEARWRYRLDVVVDHQRVYFDRPHQKIQAFRGKSFNIKCPRWWTKFFIFTANQKPCSTSPGEKWRTYGPHALADALPPPPPRPRMFKSLGFYWDDKTSTGKTRVESTTSYCKMNFCHPARNPLDM